MKYMMLAVTLFAFAPSADAKITYYSQKSAIEHVLKDLSTLSTQDARVGGLDVGSIEASSTGIQPTKSYTINLSLVQALDDDQAGTGRVCGVTATTKSVVKKSPQGITYSELTPVKFGRVNCAE